MGKMKRHLENIAEKSDNITLENAIELVLQHYLFDEKRHWADEGLEEHHILLPLLRLSKEVRETNTFNELLTIA